MKRLFSGALILGVLLFSLQALADEPKIAPPPKNKEEIIQRMKVTYNQHILPQDASPLVLEHLLEIGEVIIFYDNPPVVDWMSAAGILINAPIEIVFETITDFDHYSEFVPMTEKAVAHKIYDNFYQVDYQLNVRLAIISYKMNYGVYHYHRPPYRSDWCYAWGDFENNMCIGFYELIPTADGKRTMAFYSVYSQPRSRLLRYIYSKNPVLEKLINVSTATLVIRAIKQEAEKRYKEQGGKITHLSKPKPIFQVLEEAPESMKKILAQGKLLLLEDTSPVYVTAGSLVKADLKESWKVISNFPRYPEFIPGVKSVDCLGWGEKGPKYHWEIDMDLGIFHYKYGYDAEYEIKAPYLARWSIPIKDKPPAQGFWKLIPVDSQTLIFNGSTADLRSMGWLLRAMLKIEPTFEHALLTSQSLVNISYITDEIEKKARPEK